MGTFSEIINLQTLEGSFPALIPSHMQSRSLVLVSCRDDGDLRPVARLPGCKHTKRPQLSGCPVSSLWPLTPVTQPRPMLLR